MRKHSWLWGFGAMLLVACGVVSEPTTASRVEEATTIEATTIEAIQVEASAADPAALEFPGAEPRAVCSPGAARLCCPFPRGCSCRGVQVCGSNGEWGPCEGAGQAGQPCP